MGLLMKQQHNLQPKSPKDAAHFVECALALVELKHQGYCVPAESSTTKRERNLDTC